MCASPFQSDLVKLGVRDDLHPTLVDVEWEHNEEGSHECHEPHLWVGQDHRVRVLE